jgi:multiple sugar transport system permease protein
MDQKLLGYTPAETLAVQRAWALGIFITLMVVILGLAVWAIRKAMMNKTVFEGPTLAAGTPMGRVYRFMGFCLAPAVITLLVWSYYPLFKGLQIAFQDYRIVTGAKFVGLDNFISVFTQPVFYKALINSFVYVGLTILIGFFLPIFLALVLNEIPRGKVFFRTVFYLPAMTSSIVIAFLWRQFYDKAPTGLLNTLIAPIMLAVVLPGIWAGAGPGSILYLAALKNIPEERYEAADLDGASWWSKIRAITMPGIKPLMLINLLGVFIGGFKSMENIFVLTMGGPLNATHVMGLEVWMNAFMFLKFGYATAAAWVMGSILIGFTLIQIRSLLKMRFSTAKL